MIVTLFIPGKKPMSFTTNSLFGEVTGGRIVPRMHKVAEQLGCRPTLVDLLAIGHNYAMFAVSEHEGKINEAAMKEFTERTGLTIDPEDGVDQLLGPVLLLTVD